MAHIAAAVAVAFGTGAGEAPEWQPLAVLDMSNFDPLGGRGGAEDALLPEEAPPEPETMELPEPEPEPEEYHVLESASESAAPAPPPPAGEPPATSPKPKLKPVPERASARAAGAPESSDAAPGTGGSGPGGPPGGAGRGNPDELDAYKAEIRRRLERRKKYPPAAQARGMTGTVKVRFTVAKDGSVSSPSVVESSGHGILDDEAIALLARCSPLPPIPDGAELSTLNVSLPLKFSLN